jgi:hypothetical protein
VIRNSRDERFFVTMLRRRGVPWSRDVFHGVTTRDDVATFAFVERSSAIVVRFSDTPLRERIRADANPPRQGPDPS